MKHFILALLLLLPFAAQAGVKELDSAPDIVLPLWPDGAPTDNGARGEEVDYGDHVTNVTMPELWVWLPDHCEGVAVMATPGGAYQDVWYMHEGYKWADWYNEQGIVYAVLKYRLPRGHKEVPLDDTQRAMHLLRENAPLWGNYTKVGVQGCSAGGHLAAMTSTHYTSAENRPDFQILFYPVITLDPTYTHSGTLHNLLGEKPSKKLIEQYSNEKCVTADTPPAFILATTDDDVVPVRNSLEYYNALLAHGVSATMHIYPVGGHGWAWKESYPYHEQYKEELRQWLRLNILPRKRVLFIGDSITDGGWGNSGGDDRPSSQRSEWDKNHIFGHSYMMLCASQYQSERPLDQMTFWNRGISGHTLQQLCDRWQEDCLALRPNVVSILVGTNDVHFYLEQKAKAKEAGQEVKNFDVKAWEEQYRTLLRQTCDSLPGVRLVLCTPFVAKAGWVGEAANYYEREYLVKQLAESVERLAHDFMATLVPFDLLFAQLRENNPNGDNSYWIWDGIHPTPAGHRKMADLWMEKVKL